ncbi:hypothetical protein ACQPXB_21420 [Amycolatopsis sp. CA-161197]|uniref:hypothetical protein n=1 Tax=Amycolatopsis sp. CA-161197 TaxID=3239922 RepID=UPI003D90C016
MAADSRVSWRAVGMVGRAISAEAAFTQWTVETGKPSLNGEELADTLIGFGEVVDELVKLWSSLQCGDVSREKFESDLQLLVSRMEQFTSK